jgi:hypothetical protein
VCFLVFNAKSTPFGDPVVVIKSFGSQFHFELVYSD